MTGELKSMFESHLDTSTNLANDPIERQRFEMEERKKKEFIKKQSEKFFLFFSWDEKRDNKIGWRNPKCYANRPN
jgi:hypothetical protein